MEKTNIEVRSMIAGERGAVGSISALRTSGQTPTIVNEAIAKLICLS